uniref:WGS project CAEQ00000000 data, annotated contig 217 n=1 Tax=Trypanosoma congolense (strain IL3000) TaxID=1068625 RepID=F9WC18_TRYCI|nr:unnamed protein product [Trypanosoma congolense IL3000]
MTFATKLPATVAVVALLAVAAPRAALAFPTFRCDKVWEGPSAENDILDCLTSGETLKEQWQIIAFVAVCVLLLVAFVVGFPVALCCACFCRSRFRASEKDGGKSQRCCLWMWVASAVIWLFAVIILVLHGAELFASSTDAVIHKTVNDPLRFVNCTAERLVDLLSDWSSGERKPLHEMVDPAIVNNVLDKVDETLLLVRENYREYMKWIPYASYGVGAFAATVMTPILLFAYCECRGFWLPAALSFVYCLLGIVFMTLCLSFFVLSFGIGSLCGEMALHYERKPGVIQWYGVPFCNTKADFKALNKIIRDTESGISGSACGALLRYCDNSEAVTGNGPLNDIAALAGDTFTNLLAGIGKDSLSVQLERGKNVAASNGVDLPGGLVGGDIRRVLQDFVSHGSGGAQHDRSGVDGDAVRSAVEGSDMLADAGKVVRERNANDVTNIVQSNLRRAHIASFDIEGLLPDLNGNRPLSCGNGIKRKEDCPTLGVVAAVINATRVKKAFPICPEFGRSCTLTECAEGCRLPDARKVAKQLVRGAGLGRNVSIGLAMGRPLLECNL